MSRMSKRDFVNKFMDSIKNDVLREINQGIIPDTTTEKEILNIITKKIKSHDNY